MTFLRFRSGCAQQDSFACQAARRAGLAVQADKSPAKAGARNDYLGDQSDYFR